MFVEMNMRILLAQMFFILLNHTNLLPKHRRILQKRPNIRKEMAKNWDQNAVRDQEKVSPKQHNNSSSCLLPSVIICLDMCYLCDWSQDGKLDLAKKHLKILIGTFPYVVVVKTFENTNFTISFAALTKYQSLLLCLQHSEVTFFVGMSYLSKLTIFHLLWGLELLDFWVQS